MRTLLVVLVALAACKSTTASPLTELEKATEEMCACRNQACLSAAEERARKALPRETMATLLKEEPEAAGGLAKKIRGCVAGITSAPAGLSGPSPAAPSPASGAPSTR